jgi:HEAT repeat protein
MSWLSKLLWSGEQRPPASWAEWMTEAGSRSGYAREAAVQALALSGHGDALPVLLERVNDWVPEVRRAAYAAVEGFLDEEHLGAWGRALGQVAALRRMARADHTRLLQSIEDFLSSPAHLSALKGAQAGMPRAAVRLLLSLELRAAGDEETRYGVLRSAVLSADIAVASHSAALIETLELPARRFALAGAACLSSYAAVRVMGLRAALRSREPSVQSLVRALVRDPSASVRAIALGALADGRDQVIDEARRLLRSGQGARARAVALDMLCALGTDDAMALCERVAGDPAVAVRCVGYARRFATSTGNARDELIVQALRDRSPRVRRLAVVQVKKGAAVPTSATLLEIHSADTDAVASLVSVAAHLSPWSRLDFLLNLVTRSGTDLALAEQLHRDLDRWNSDMLRCFVRPLPDQVRAVATLWGMTRAGLPEELQRGLAFQLHAFGILAAQ